MRIEPPLTQSEIDKSFYVPKAAFYVSTFLLLIFGVVLGFALGVSKSARVAAYAEAALSEARAQCVEQE